MSLCFLKRHTTLKSLHSSRTHLNRYISYGLLQTPRVLISSHHHTGTSYSRDSLPTHSPGANCSISVLSAKESGLCSSSFIFGLVVSATGLLIWTWYYPSADFTGPAEEEPQKVHIDPDFVPAVRVYPGMPATILPGRPGNLTPDQEVKLRDLWLALMALSGAAPGPTPHVEESSSVDTSEKRKSRFGGLLGRKKVEDDTAVDLEDKHNQVQEYKQALKDQTPAQLRESFWSFSKADDPDAMLLRFLRARKWDVQKALVMMVSTIHWRGQVVHLDDEIMPSGEGGAHRAEQTGSAAAKKRGGDFLAQMRLGKSFVHGTDKDGRPMCFVRVRLHKQGEQSEESLERFTVFTIETARMMLRPPVDTAVIVFDMTDFSLANMDYGPVKFMIKCFEANYPESLGHVLVHKSPWVFQGIWKIIRGWLDPVVASKIHFTKDVHELAELIPLSQIPKEMGGQENWEYSYVEPRSNEDAKMADTGTRDRLDQERRSIVNEYEKATIQWCKQGGGQDLDRQRLMLADKLRENYWKLDPYVRARSLYDRTGVIRPGGQIDFYPKSAATHATDVD